MNPNSNLTVLIVVALTIGYIIKYTFNHSKINKSIDLEDKKLFFGINSRRDLYNLTDSEFEEWCGRLLRRLGYKNVYVTQRVADGGKDITCEKDGEKYYVECKKFMYKELKDYLEKNGGKKIPSSQLVGREIMQKLIGAMIADRVDNGIVITTSEFSSSAIEYVNKLPNSFSIEMIDGKKLYELYENVIYYEALDYPKKVLDVKNSRF